MTRRLAWGAVAVVAGSSASVRFAAVGVDGLDHFAAGMVAHFTVR